MAWPEKTWVGGPYPSKPIAGQKSTCTLPTAAARWETLKSASPARAGYPAESSVPLHALGIHELESTPGTFTNLL